MPDQISPTPVLRRSDELDSRPDWARDLYLRRVEKGMTQEALARASGIDWSVISLYEHDHRRPGVVNARRLDEALS